MTNNVALYIASASSQVSFYNLKISLKGWIWMKSYLQHFCTTPGCANRVFHNMWMAQPKGQLFLYLTIQKGYFLINEPTVDEKTEYRNG